MCAVCQENSVIEEVKIGSQKYGVCRPCKFFIGTLITMRANNLTLQRARAIHAFIYA